MEISLFMQLLFITLIIFFNKDIYVPGFKQLLKRSPYMDSLISIGTITAYFYSIMMLLLLWNEVGDTLDKHIYFKSTGIILVFISLGKYLEEKTKRKTSESLKKLIELQPRTATII